MDKGFEKMVSTIIRVSPEVAGHISANGKYGDSADAVLRRLLGLPGKKIRG